MLHLIGNHWMDPAQVAHLGYQPGNTSTRVYLQDGQHFTVSMPQEALAAAINEALVPPVRAVVIPDVDPDRPITPGGLIETPVEDLGSDKPDTGRRRPPGGGW